MGSEWKETTLGAIARKGDFGLVDGPFGSNLPASSYTQSGIPVIRGSNLSCGTDRLRDNEFVYVSAETAGRLARSICVPLDIIFTKKGTLGQTGLIPEDGEYSKYLLSSNQMKLTVEPGVAHPLFVYYFVSSAASVNKILQDSEATGVPKTNVAYLKTFPITLPPLPEQKAIAHILGSLDDKIELNRRMNETLEGMAQALFKSWFVDFDPVLDNAIEAGNPIPRELAKRAKVRRKALKAGTANRTTAKQFPDAFRFTEEMGWIPEGWEVVALGEMAKFRNGKKSPGSIGGSIPVFGSNGQIGKCTDYNRKDAVIIGRVGTYCGSLHYSKRQCWATDNTMTGEMNDKENNLYLFYLLEFADLNSRRGGSGQPLLNQNILKSISAGKPSDELISRYSSQSRGLYDKIFFNNKIIKNLTKLRDTLLPKLISGELRVSDAERMIKNEL